MTNQEFFSDINLFTDDLILKYMQNIIVCSSG